MRRIASSRTSRRPRCRDRNYFNPFASERNIPFVSSWALKTSLLSRFISRGRWAVILFGYGLLQFLVLVRLVPLIRHQRLDLSYWGITFGFTALTSASMKMAARSDGPLLSIMAPCLLIISSVIVLPSRSEAFGGREAMNVAGAEVLDGSCRIRGVAFNPATPRGVPTYFPILAGGPPLPPPHRTQPLKI